MQPKVVRSTRADAIDEQHFREMTETEAFGIFLARVQAELARAVAACERAVSMPEVRKAQGAAMALRAVLGLPAAILAKLKPKAEPAPVPNKRAWPHSTP